MTANNSGAKLGAILLAAGGSTRLGHPKQLVEVEGETLLRRAARSLVGSQFEPVVVVLGSESESCGTHVRDLPVTLVTNGRWHEGMSTSIRAGLGKLLEIEPTVDAALIALCDQPNITARHLNKFAAVFRETGADLIAAAYGGTVGVPALFGSRSFRELEQLEGDKGARQLIRERPNVVTIDLPEAAFDIDRPADLSLLVTRRNN